MKSVTINGIQYDYQVGKSDTRLRAVIDGKRIPGTIAVGSGDVVGVSPDTWERGQWKRTRDGQVTPGAVAFFIKTFTKIVNGRFVKKDIKEIELKDPIITFPFPFRGLHGFPAKCMVSVWQREGSPFTIIMATDMNQGVSVTNAWGHPVDLAGQIYHAMRRDFPFPADPNQIIWVEHYERDPKEYDLVFMKYKDDHFWMDEEQHPWRRMTMNDLRALGLL